MGKAIGIWVLAGVLLLFGIRDAAAYGTITWTVLFGKTVRSSPALASDGTIYFGCDDKNVYAYDPNGTQKWAFPAGEFLRAPAIVGPDGTVYLGVATKLYALNPVDGTKKWEFDSGIYFDDYKSPLALGKDGTILVGTLIDGNYFLTALNPDNTIKWQRQVSQFGVIIIGGDNTIYLSDYYDRTLLALTPDGSIKWESIVAGLCPAIGVNGTIYLGSGQGRLYALNPDGSTKWDFFVGQVETTVGGPVIGPNGTIYVGSQDQIFSQALYNKLYALEPDGSKKWEFQTPHGTRKPPAIGADGKIYLAAQGLSYNGKLYGFYPDGTLDWEFTSEGFIYTSPVIGSDGSVYIGSLLRGVRAISSSSKGLAKSHWPMFQHDAQHTGRFFRSSISGYINNLLLRD
jgi:outer membrane protein assembly factor BamB